MNGNYDDIINLPHHVSATRPQMPMMDRAAQFSPFAALTGHDAAIKETARLTEAQVELDEHEIEVLDGKLQSIRMRLKDRPAVSITYFRADDKKAGGAYLTVTGVIKKVDDYEQAVHMMNGEAIPIVSIIDISEEN